MGLTRKKGDLAALSAKLTAARSDVASAEARLLAAESEHESAIEQLAETYQDSAELAAQRSSTLDAVHTLERERDALSEVVASLERRCGQLATEEAQGRVEALRASLDAVHEERAEAEAKVATIAAKAAALEDELDDARDHVHRAAREWDSEVRAAAETADRQEAETIAWLVRSGTRTAIEHETGRRPPRFRKLVQEALDAADAERERRREKLQLDAVVNAAAVGRDLTVDPNAVRDGHPYPQVPR